MSRTHKIAWAAGFFDGEGYVSIQKRSHPKYVGHYLRIGVKHVAPEPLYVMQVLFGGTVTRQKSKPTGNRKAYHRWVTSTRNAADSLKLMMPFFENKNNVAALALDFQKTITRENCSRGISDDVLDYRNWCFDEMQRLNSLD